MKSYSKLCAAIDVAFKYQWLTLCSVFVSTQTCKVSRQFAGVLAGKGFTVYGPNWQTRALKH